MADSASVWMFPLAVVLLVGVPTVTSWQCTHGYGIIYTDFCNWPTTKCCASGGYTSAKCCRPTTCTNLYTMSTCTKYTQSMCCSRSYGARESCCNYYDWSRTSSSSYWGKYSTTTCTGEFGNNLQCSWPSTKCCSSGGYTSGKCCKPTTCTSAYYTSTCTKYTQSKCCSRSFGDRESCCDYYDWSRTSSSSFWGKYSTKNSWSSNSAPIGVIVGGVIGGIVILVLIIVIPVVACGVCAAAGSNRRRQQTTVITRNQGYGVQSQGGYVNQGYTPPNNAQTVPPTAEPPPAYDQAVNMPMPGQQPTGQASAPPGQAMYPPPQGQYPPPVAAEPAQPPSIMI